MQINFDEVRKNYNNESSKLGKICNLYQYDLKNNVEALDYCLTKRKIFMESIDKFCIGYGSGEDKLLKFFNLNSIDSNTEDFKIFCERIIFPNFDVFGGVVGFTGRVWNKDEKLYKYINSHSSDIYQKSLVIYGLYQALPAIKELGYVFLVEGNIDVVMCHQFGITTAVCPGSTSFTKEQALLLSLFTDKIVCCFDSDVAGVKSATKVDNLCKELNLQFYNLKLSGAKDTDEFLNKYGVEPIKEVIVNLW